MKAPTTARFPWFSRSAELDHSDTCKSAIGVRFMVATIFGNGLLGVRLSMMVVASLEPKTNIEMR